MVKKFHITLILECFSKYKSAIQWMFLCKNKCVGILWVWVCVMYVREQECKKVWENIWERDRGLGKRERENEREKEKEREK